MTTQTFETSKGTLIAVRLPEGAKPVCLDKIRHFGSDSLLWLEMVNGSFKKRWLYLPPGDWKALGLLKDITEEQADEVVEWVETGEYYFDCSRPTEAGWNGDITAIESLHSLLQTKIPLMHDFPEPNPENYFNINVPVNELTEEDKEGLNRYSSDLMRWESGEGQVWKNPFLIFKTK